MSADPTVVSEHEVYNQAIGYDPGKEDCNKYVKEVLDHAGANLTSAEQHRLGNMEIAKTENLQTLVRNNDLRITGVGGALTLSGKGVQVTLPNLQRGDFLQTWELSDKEGSRDGVRGHASVVMSLNTDGSINIRSTSTGHGANTTRIFPDRFLRIYAVRPILPQFGSTDPSNITPSYSNDQTAKASAGNKAWSLYPYPSSPIPTSQPTAGGNAGFYAYPSTIPTGYSNDHATPPGISIWLQSTPAPHAPLASSGTGTPQPTAASDPRSFYAYKLPSPIPPPAPQPANLYAQPSPTVFTPQSGNLYAPPNPSVFNTRSQPTMPMASRILTPATSGIGMASHATQTSGTLQGDGETPGSERTDEAVVIESAPAAKEEPNKNEIELRPDTGGITVRDVTTGNVTAKDPGMEAEHITGSTSTDSHEDTESSDKTEGGDTGGMSGGEEGGESGGEGGGGG